ncbi:MAG TPA: plastocyanin/azurin family copper-binding protein [candidate division Zixibacteria bacterium]|nr:plastocyanin/azurin family copper-binding protein [candidate division Zixibacteria bacterium]
MRFLKAAAMVAGLILLAQTAWAKTDTVRMQDFQFVPKILVVNPGDTVVWKSVQECCLAHTSTRSLTSSWNSGPVPLNGTFQRAFTESGSYEYFCDSHRTIGMVGQITVTSRVPSSGWLGLTLLLASLTAATLWVLEQRKTTLSKTTS